MTPAEEVEELGVFYGTAVEAFVSRHRAGLERYAEWVLGRDGFAVVTLGSADTLAELGRGAAVHRFRSAAARWPGAITGVKVDPCGREVPTLYVRPLCSWQEGTAWLEREVGLSATQLPAARTMYGLGFQGGLVKTYVLSPEGFVSWRLDGTTLQGERKDYRADVPWESITWPDARWSQIGALGQKLGFRSAGHVGRSSPNGELKIYVERVGAIPTDRSLA
jgi:hypothetical protein